MSEVQICFPRLNNFWNDSGVLGIYRCIKGDVHADIQHGDNELYNHLGSEYSVTVDLERDGLKIGGEAKDVEAVLEGAYGRLVKRYYDVSTQKQRDEKSSWNFYYDSKKDQFATFPKRKAQGIAALIFNKAPRPAGGQIRWKDKNQPGLLPDTYAHMQDRLDGFLEQHNLKPGPPAGMLLDEPNRVRPKVKVRVKEGTQKPAPCFLCSQYSSSMEKVNQTIFPFITGDSGVRSFFNLTREVAQVCWRCAYVGKFVPVNGFFSQAGNRLHMFLPFAPDLLKMDEVYDTLSSIVDWEPNFWRNFESHIGGYFNHPREVGFSFLHRVYTHLARDRKDANQDGGYSELMDVVWSDAPLSFALISAEQKGNTQMPTQVWLFDDVVYLFRLFQYVEKQKGAWKDIAHSMVDFTAQRNENRSLERDRLLGSVLRKQSILRQAEAFAYHINREGRQYFAPLFDFVINYEDILRKKGESMETQAREAAVTLGRRIGSVIAKEGGKKGSLFALRKCRTLPDFLSELNRLQFKWKIAVPPASYEGQLDQTNFEEFRGFCMLAALNSFNAGTASIDEKGEQ
ncbi:MAG: hypothetical protein OXR72_07085 [Gemmatimonadota bacterium]|nr:hypothetical protein [Gemmatimonadota bacterium]